MMTESPTYEELKERVRDLEEAASKWKRIEEALRQSEERLALAVEATTDGIWDWDIKNNKTYASQRCSEIFGVTGDAAFEGPSGPSETWASRIHPDDYERVSQCLRAHLTGEAPYHVEYRHRHENGEYRWQSFRGKAFFDENGDAIRMVGSIRDISERKRSEEEKARLEARLQQAQKIEALGTLARGVAHDFNNLLTAILGNIELSQMHAQQEERINKKLIEAKRACRRAKDLTKQFMAFSKGADPERKTGSILKLIRESCVIALSGYKTKCEFSLPDDLWPVKYDNEQMRQVISNLVMNASEAMQEEGTINVSAENIDPSEGDLDDGFSGKKQIRISIQDHGRGIPKEMLDKIFDPYFSSKESVTQKGMGLGLSICYSIIDKHDGLIEVESEVGTGTTFHIYLPA